MALSLLSDVHRQNDDEHTKCMCKLKTKCPLRNHLPALLTNCWADSCTGCIHEGCCKLILDKCDVPTEEHPAEEDHPTDGEWKSCFLHKHLLLEVVE